MLRQARAGHEVHVPHAARAGHAIFFALLGVFFFPGIASALVALGVALALTTAGHLARSLSVRVRRATRSRNRGRHAPHVSVEGVPPVVLVSEAEVEAGLG